MSDFQPIADEDNIWLRKKHPKQTRPPKQARPLRPARPPGTDTPWGTLICCILCGGIFLLILATGGQGGSPALEHALYPRPYAVWGGAYWGPLTAAFVHFDIMHVGFNIYWLFIFGRALEQHFGTRVLLTLVITAAFLSSSCQMAFSDSGGIGASGFNYALFGFLWMARKKVAALEEQVPDRLVHFFLFWLVLCFFLTKAGLWPVANAAHSSGLIFGCLVAATFVLDFRRIITIPALALLSLVLLTPAFYAPWSSAWNWRKGYALLDENQFEKAIGHFEFVLTKDPSDEQARHNLDLARSQLGWAPDERWPPRPDED